jgi:hypothetical protein
MTREALTHQQRLVAALKAAGCPLTLTDLSIATSIDRKRCSQVLTWLAEEGAIAPADGQSGKYKRWMLAEQLAGANVQRFTR